ncbi:hypothetical protein ABGT24_19540 [Peribacillus frigoritolerans]|uniref:hypothetical protein n=1 Tax=Peribacillus frigoritolerans TaxID=450367 RepID=UPI00345CBCFE
MSLKRILVSLKRILVSLEQILVNLEQILVNLEQILVNLEQILVKHRNEHAFFLCHLSCLEFNEAASFVILLLTDLGSIVKAAKR